ncbi:hypothetical protein [Legionella fallonii]|uniref:hypothetical protein n=1 Tax=Legionella fallonii TaxID=96230 RepID=UPI0012EE7C2E|nr:hypothetical protein [Legionella fallonii]
MLRPSPPIDALVQESDLISDEELQQASITMQLQINMLCIFEAITITMANGENFAQDVYEHLSQRSGTPYPGNPIADFFFGVPFNASLF